MKRQLSLPISTMRDALKTNGRNKVVVSGLWTEVCNITFAISAMLEGGYEIYMVADASGGTSKEAHDYAMQRMIQAGVVPVTWQPVMLEWQRDWARKDTYDAVMTIAREHSRLWHGLRLCLHHGPQGVTAHDEAARGAATGESVSTRPQRRTYSMANIFHHSGKVRKDRTVPTPTMSEMSGAFRPYWAATIAPPICGAMADSNSVT